MTGSKISLMVEETILFDNTLLPDVPKAATATKSTNVNLFIVVVVRKTTYY